MAPVPDKRARLALFLSGSGRTMVNLADHIEAGDLPAEIGLVIASRECQGAERARERGFAARVMPGEIDPAHLAHILKEHAIDWAVLAGYTQLLPIVPAYESRTVNIHPALLPKFGGEGMFGSRVHQAVLDAGETESGCTVHLCDDHYDTGPIVLQMKCPVEPDDTPDTLAARVFELELEAYPAALRQLITENA